MRGVLAWGMVVVLMAGRVLKRRPRTFDSGRPAFCCRRSSQRGGTLAARPEAIAVCPEKKQACFPVSPRSFVVYRRCTGQFISEEIPVSTMMVTVIA